MEVNKMESIQVSKDGRLDLKYTPAQLENLHLDRIVMRKSTVDRVIEYSEKEMPNYNIINCDDVFVHMLNKLGY